MAIAPADFSGRARPTHQGYVRNADDVAAYSRAYGSVTFGSSSLALLNSQVELRPTEKSAHDSGDGSVALSTSFTSHGISFKFGFCIFQRDRVVETLGALSLPRGKIPLIDTRRLALTAVARIDQALN